MSYRINVKYLTACMRNAMRKGLDPYNSANAYAGQFARQWARNAVRNERTAHMALTVG